MAVRQNTIVCTFDPTSPRITAFEIHEWIHDTLKIPEQKVRMIQIDGTKRQVYIKLMEREYSTNIIRETGGQVMYKHGTGEISYVDIAMAGMGFKKIRIANLPPEVPEEKLRTTLAPYGSVMSIQDEVWARSYRYTVANGIRQANMSLSQHIPSHLTIAGHRVLISYEGQPATCYGCGGTDHLYQACPRRQRRALLRNTEHPFTYAAVVASPHSSAEDSQQNGPESPSQIDMVNQIEPRHHDLDTTTQPTEQQSSESVMPLKNDVTPTPKAARRNTGNNAKPQHPQMKEAERATEANGEEASLKTGQGTEEELGKNDHKNSVGPTDSARTLSVGGGKR